MKETKLEIPAGCEVDKIETQDGHILVTFREKERKLPKSWEEFCEMFPIKRGKEYYFNVDSEILNDTGANCVRDELKEKNMLPDRATAEAVLVLCQLIQLRDCYNGDWVPDWGNDDRKYVIEFCNNCILQNEFYHRQASPLYFKTEELRDEFMRYFRPLIEKLMPLYGIKEGGEE